MLHRFERPQSIAEAARLLASGSWAVLAGAPIHPRTSADGRRAAADITVIAARHARRSRLTTGATTT
jgi:hypothetical protein